MNGPLERLTIAVLAVAAAGLCAIVMGFLYLFILGMEASCVHFK
jgi:hypothetical protein